ncbi:glycosyl transferase family 4-domain-containing protein [Lipomyces tetrasporus]|uniref:UDP-N-acetylglucosamine--dolichyl-phosphate N-acetylglucosaminephosphotransferase n=1 Tax=Lipomyces tetrasporus TaxID=54092 RepID=A0AAD7QX09_9ASCO|nr:glycosyl transferase family 4-domain-containing protein [Lipomyces tetrasporus]KAJ8103055.1 glycosyl transferase family 4-domain-containing protein [Lipomyces tetrasporus]
MSGPRPVQNDRDTGNGLPKDISSDEKPVQRGAVPTSSSIGSNLGTLLLVGFSLALIFNSEYDPLLACIGFSVLAYVITAALIPILGPDFVRVGFFGRDLGKKDRPIIPETMGAVCAVVYLVTLFFFIPFLFYKFFVTETSGSGNREHVLDTATLHKGRSLRMFPHSKLAEFLAALLSSFSMLVLGVADDLFDIRWRNKLFLPAIAVLPLIFVYYVDFGVTSVVVPPFIWKLLNPGMNSTSAVPPIVDLGAFYYLYMLAMAIFCPNSINILAGINGLEAGQSLVIAIFLLINDAMYIVPGRILGLHPPHPATEAHLLSTYFVLPLVAVTAALLKYNWYPARVFVGDTYCYFAGMVFAQVCILGHFAKTLLLFLVPQIVNFIYSAPQLFKLVNCPRHRLPKLNAETGLLEPSRVYFVVPPKGAQLLLLTTLGNLKLLDLELDPETRVVKSSSNFTVINLVLTWTGPLREDRLALLILAIQTGCCAVGLVARHTIAPAVFGRDNL